MAELKQNNGKKWVCPKLPIMSESFRKIKKRVNNNDVPKEWDELYENIIYIINEHFKDSGNTYFYKEMDVPYEVYKAYYKDNKDAPNSPAILLNEYLSKKLRKEGYKHSFIRMIYIPSEGSMWAKEINTIRQHQYELNYKEWQAKKLYYDVSENNEILGSKASVGKAPTAPTLESSYVPSRYIIVVQCAKEKSKKVKQIEQKIMKLQRQRVGIRVNGSLLVFLCYVAPVALLFGLIYGIGYILNYLNPDFEIEDLFAFTSVIFIVGGLLIGWGIHTLLYNKGFLK